MKRKVEPVVAGKIQAMVTELVIEYHGIHEQRPVVGIFHGIKKAPLEGNGQVAQVFIVFMKVTYEDGIIQIGKPVLQ